MFDPVTAALAAIIAAVTLFLAYLSKDGELF